MLCAELRLVSTGFWAVENMHTIPIEGSENEMVKERTQIHANVNTRNDTKEKLHVVLKLEAGLLAISI